MKTFDVLVLGAKEHTCKGCGRRLLSFEDNAMVSHEPPECEWFAKQCDDAGLDVLEESDGAADASTASN